MSRQAEHVEQIGDFLAIRWAGGDETVIPLVELRSHCPCAECSGEPDVTGAVRMPAHRKPLTEASFELGGFDRVGAYALALTWGDGHSSGIYSWDLLRELGSRDRG